MPHARRRLALPLLAALAAAGATAAPAAALDIRTFTWQPPAPAPTADVALADFDGDGQRDLVALGGDGRVGRWAWSDSAGFVARPVGGYAAVEARMLAVGDVAGTAFPEVVVAGRDGLGVSTNPDGAFGGPAVWTVVGGLDPIGLELADVVPGGRREALVLDAATQAVRVFAADASDRWAATGVAVPTPADARDLAVGDFDDDGHPDVAVSSDGGGRTMAALGDGAGGFAPPRTLPPGGSGMPWSLAAGDFDEDGDDDLAIAYRGGAHLGILLSDGAGGFVHASDVVVGAGPEGLAVGDLNRDGHLDLATLPGRRAELNFVLGDGRGGFAQAHWPRPSYGGSPDVALGDVDGDGLDDALLFSGGGVAVLHNATRAASATTPPSISGTPRAGETLTCEPGAWTGSDPLSAATVEWRRDGAPIPGASAATYVVTAEDRGATLTCAETVGNELPAVTAASPGVDVPAPPAVATGAATAVGTATATLNGVVEPRGGATTYRFQYGPTAAYGRETPAATLPADAPPTAVTARLDGLAPGTTHHVRLVAVNEHGTTAGADVTFATERERPPVDPPRPPVDPPLPPVDPPAPPAAPRIEAAPSALGRARTVTLAFSGAPAFECRVDDGPWVPCASPYVLAGLRAGDHTAAVRGIGADGRRGEASTVAFQVNPYAPGVRVGAARLRAARGGATVGVGIACSALEGAGRGACRGTVTLRTTGARPRALGRATFQAAAGRTATARVRLTTAGRRALRAARGPLRVRVVVRATDLAGNPGTVSRAATLRR